MGALNRSEQPGLKDVRVSTDITNVNLSGKVALITGGSNGFGAGLAARLTKSGANVLIADIDQRAGLKVANETGAQFVQCDVSSYKDNVAAVNIAVQEYGGLDIAVLNAGVTSDLVFGAGFDPERYKTVMSINIDGVVFGFNAALQAMRERGGGSVIATASMAGLAPTPFDPVYSANKSAVVGFVRSAGIAHAAENIRVNAVCPAFADTDILGQIRAGLVDAGVPLLTVPEVVDVFMQIIVGSGSGECWWVQPGRPSEPFGFRRAPGPRTSDGSIAPAADPATQMRIEEGIR